jgi:hypothetical protein
LLAELLSVAKEVDLNAQKGTSRRILEEAAKADRKKPDHAARQKAVPPSTHPLLALLSQRSDLAGLPARQAGECVQDETIVQRMAAISQALRRNQALGAQVGAEPENPSSPGSEMEAVEELDTLPRAWWQEGGIPTLVQMLQTHVAPVRRQLVKKLAQAPSRISTEWLARRALFDLSGEARQEAVQALWQRPARDARPILLAGLRYPWAPVADHAAEALVGLADLESVGALVNLLDEPDPCRPVKNTEGKWVVSELVRVNHLRNCLLCHAPSLDKQDPLRGVVPVAGQPLNQVYYASQRGTFVRADVTYLRQDFSVMHPVEDDGLWPARQRFDYLVRRRTLTEGDHLAGAVAAAAGLNVRPASYPQRDAVLFALRELTGLDAGTASADWRLALWTNGIATGP